MGKQKQVSLFKSKTMRVTEVDFAGRPVIGPESVIVTNGQITVQFTGNVEEGEALSGTNGNGDICWTEPSDPTFTGYNVEATFCNVDFALFEKLTGHPVVLNDDGTIVGIEEGSTVKLSDVTFALELWTGAKSTDLARTGAQGDWGYILTPFLRGGTITDITVENAAITFGVTGMVTKNGTNWGAGPYNVELVGGVPAPLFQPVAKTAYRRTMSVEVAPPAVFEGSVPLLDRTDPALTDFTATPTGLSVSFVPVPAGTDPVWYEFGDGNWDLAETGSYTHVYEAAGTYTVTARRGTSVVTKTVTVTA
jgi:hypothetical protein